MGNTHGHVMRTSAILENLPGQHTVQMVGGGRVPEAFAGRYQVHEVPVLRTVHRRQQVAVDAVVGQIVRRIAELPAVTRRLCTVMEAFQPDLVVSDREFFLPIACRKAGVECLSIDHSHVMKACHYPVPHDQLLSWTLAMVNDWLLFDFTRTNLVVSFFHPPLRRGRTDRLLRPVLRREVRAAAALRDQPPGESIFVYQTSPTFLPLLETLKQSRRRVVIYGMSPENRTDGNLEYRAYDRQRIVEDLAGCAYAVVNGGHNLICEALYFGKPVLCFPIHLLFEQWINAWHVRALGFGDFSLDPNPAITVFEAFEQHLEHYQQRLRGADFDGTPEVVAALQSYLPGQVP